MGNQQSNITLLATILTNCYPIELDPLEFSKTNKTFDIPYSKRNLYVKEHSLNPIIDDYSIASLRLVCKTFKLLIDDYFKDAKIDQITEYAEIYGEYDNLIENIGFRISFNPWWTIRHYIPAIKESFIDQANRAQLCVSDMGFNPYLTFDIIFEIIMIKGAILSPYDYTYNICFRRIKLLEPPNLIYLAKSFAKCLYNSRMLAFLVIIAKISQKECRLLFIRDFLINMFSNKKFYKQEIFKITMKMMRSAGACEKGSNLLKNPEEELWIYNTFNNGVMDAIIYLYEEGYLNKCHSELIRLFPGMWHSPDYFLTISSISPEMFQMTQYIAESIAVCKECVRKESPKPLDSNVFLNKFYDKASKKINPSDIYVNFLLYKMKLEGENIEKYGLEPNIKNFKIRMMNIMKILSINEKSNWYHSNNALDLIMTEIFLTIIAKSKSLSIWQFFLETLLGPIRDCVNNNIMIPSLFACIIPPVKSKKENPEYVSTLIKKIISYVKLVEEDEIFKKASIQDTEFIQRQNLIVEMIKNYLYQCKIKYDIVGFQYDASTKKAKEIIEKLNLGMVPYKFEFYPNEA